MPFEICLRAIILLCCALIQMMHGALPAHFGLRMSPSLVIRKTCFLAVSCSISLATLGVSLRSLFWSSSGHSELLMLTLLLCSLKIYAELRFLSLRFCLLVVFSFLPCTCHRMATPSRKPVPFTGRQGQKLACWDMVLTACASLTSPAQGGRQDGSRSEPILELDGCPDGSFMRIPAFVAGLFWTRLSMNKPNTDQGQIRKAGNARQRGVLASPDRHMLISIDY